MKQVTRKFGLYIYECNQIMEKKQIIAIENIRMTGLSKIKHKRLLELDELYIKTSFIS